MDGVVDGVAPDPAVAALTLKRIRKYLSERPTIYLPSHDPDSLRRLEMRMTASRPQPRPAVVS